MHNEPVKPKFNYINPIVRMAVVESAGRDYLRSLEFAYRRAELEVNLHLSDPSFRKSRLFVESFRELESALDRLSQEPTEQSRIKVSQAFNQLSSSNQLYFYLEPPDL
jgi:hypothetical protein